VTVSIEQIRQAMAIVARIIETHPDGEKAWPWFERLERELATRGDRAARITAARSTVSKPWRSTSTKGVGPPSRSSGSSMVDEQADTNFAQATLDEMITHDQALERYPWLSAQIINRWRRRRLIRYFRGKGCVLYSKAELDRALESEMRIDDPPEPRQRPPRTPSERDKAISAVVTEEESLRLISKGGVLSADQVEQINRKRQEVDLGPTTSEPRLPPGRTKRSQRNTTARAPRGKKTKSVD